MTRLLLFDTAFRLLSAGQLLLIALVVGRSMAPARIRSATVLLLVCVAAYLAVVSPVLHVGQSWLWPAIQLASQSAPLALWLFAHRIFERPIDRRLGVGAVLVTLGCWIAFVHAHYVSHQWPLAADLAMHLTSLALALHSIAIAIAERGDDLLEKRRMFRTGFVILVGVQTLGIVAAETWYGTDRTQIWLMLVQSGTTLVSVMAFGAVMLSANAELLADPEASSRPRSPLSPAEHVLKLKLDAAMASGAYRSPGLTIGVLAENLGVPEHRLRALINQRLGYRNFSAFLNAHRISDARAWLGDPGKVDLPVLTIAMDLGYGSLAPFNRAFRDATGQTPSEYRRSVIVDPGKD